VGRTYELLRRTESNLKSRQKQDEIFSELEVQLHKIGLHEEQLSNQNLSEIISSLTRLNLCIKSPFSFLRFKSGDGRGSGPECRPEIVHALVKLKRLALMRYDLLVNRKKCGQIRRIAKEIKDRDIQTAIENSLYQLELKDQIVKKEYLKLDRII